MRSLLLLPLLLLPAPIAAETFTLPSRATAATIYSSGARVTHALTLDVPAGRHSIVLPDLPPDLPLDALRVMAPDLRLGAIRYRRDLTPPRGAEDGPDIAAARDRIAQIEARIDAVEQTAARQRLDAAAARARIAFLAALRGTDAPDGPDALRALLALIGSETVSAGAAELDAERAVEETLRGRAPLERELADARQALAALVPEPEDRPLLVLDVLADTDLTDAPLQITFAAEARWEPSYDLRLTLDPAPQLLIERGARVAQASGENWQGVALTLSTQRITGALEPDALEPDLRRIYEPGELYPVLRSTGLNAALDDAPMPAPAMETLEAEAQGLSVRYTWPNPVDVASGADEIRLPFDMVTLEPEIVARAVPLNAGTAFLVARVTNTTGAPLLAGRDVLRFVEGGLVGRGSFGAIEAGAQAEIGFGSIDGLQLTRRTLARGEGDRGVLRREAEVTEETRITLENLTARAWDVELRDRVPYSEQEDLVITYRAEPVPDVEGVGGRRGVLEWRLTLEPGAETAVTTSHRMTWPEGQRIR